MYSQRPKRYTRNRKYASKRDNTKENKMNSLSEQLQQNILTYLDGYDIPQVILDDLCEIVIKTTKEIK
jgi:hypothetical protein